MPTTIQVRRDSASTWASVNPTLADGELGFETDTGKVKIGTGSTAWNSLDYIVGKYTLDQLSQIQSSGVASNDLIGYNSSGYWENKTASSLGLASTTGYRLKETIIYTSSTSVTFASDIRAIKVTSIGGGGGSGGCAIGSASAGGSGGNRSESFLLVSNMSPTIGITVGAGGAAGSDSPSSGTDGGASGVYSYYPGIITSADNDGGDEKAIYTFTPGTFIPLSNKLLAISGLSTSALNITGRMDDRSSTSFILTTGNKNDITLTGESGNISWYHNYAYGGNGGLSESALTAPDYENGTAPVDATSSTSEGDLKFVGGASNIVSFETSADLYNAKPGAAPGYPIGLAPIAISTGKSDGYSANAQAYGAGGFGAASISSAKAAGGAGNQGIVIIEYYV
jgi:hypothetical protein